MKTTDRQKFTILLGLFLVLLTLGTTLKAQLPSPPNPPRLVNDYTGTLTAHQVSVLEHKLVAYNDSTSTQILVLLVNDLQGYSIEQYATEIGHSWGVGQKGKNNGVVILVKPKKGNEQGRVNISPGYGMEQYVTDATAKRIIERAFKEDDYYTGIDNAVNVIIDLCSGKFTQDEYGEEEGSALLGFLFILAIILLVIYLKRNQTYSSGGARSIWIPMGGGGFGGGSFGGGSGGGGGFSGFGGGGFGGGGASGSW